MRHEPNLRGASFNETFQKQYFGENFGYIGTSYPFPETYPPSPVRFGREVAQESSSAGHENLKK